MGSPPAKVSVGSDLALLKKVSQGSLFFTAAAKDIWADYFALAATCKLWRSHIKQAAFTYPHVLPLLILPYGSDEKKQTYHVFSLSDDRMFELKLSYLPGLCMLCWVLRWMAGDDGYNAHCLFVEDIHLQEQKSNFLQ
ncbi:hypothetical protein ACLOJK_039358 [Asimina triloba]